jgi:hypothetical protein
LFQWQAFCSGLFPVPNNGCVLGLKYKKYQRALRQLPGRRAANQDKTLDFTIKAANDGRDSCALVEKTFMGRKKTWRSMLHKKKAYWAGILAQIFWREYPSA